MTTMTMIHEVRSVELTKTNSLTSAGGLFFWRRQLNVIDKDGNLTQITLFSSTEEQLEIKEITV
jgi:hypothetical protein